MDEEIAAIKREHFGVLRDSHAIMIVKTIYGYAVWRWLSQALLDAIDEFSEHNRLTTGQAMGALFTVMVQSAQASAEYDPRRLVQEVDAKIREAVGLH